MVKSALKAVFKAKHKVKACYQVLNDGEECDFENFSTSVRSGRRGGVCETFQGECIRLRNLLHCIFMQRNLKECGIISIVYKDYDSLERSKPYQALCAKSKTGTSLIRASLVVQGNMISK